MCFTTTAITREQSYAVSADSTSKTKFTMAYSSRVFYVVRASSMTILQTNIVAECIVTIIWTFRKVMDFQHS